MKKLVNTKSKEELLAEIEKENFRRKTLSFYKYVKIADPKKMRDFLFENFEKLGCLGRIYVAHEGINAQMNVPEHNFDAFDKFIQSMPEFSGVPYKIALEERVKSSFLKLIVKVRPKIVADGLNDETFDPSNTGQYVTAEEVNNMIDRGATVIDMRNFYEAEIGHFENAKIMPVDTFREQLAKVDEMFRDEKDKEILLYCTGGIRCEKASAWMKHKGFKNVKHVKGGVIGYAHQVKEKGLPNKFLGKNFVFDERLGERIGNEIISVCHLCDKNKTDEHRHCKNVNCHVLHLSCGDCLQKLGGYCSRFCAVCDKLPAKMNRFLIRRDRRQQHKNQYRKNYIRGKHSKSLI
jgi:UPF0176 protein